MHRFTCFLAALMMSVSVAAVDAQAPATAPADVRFGPLADTNTKFKPPRYASLDEWKARRAWLHDQILVAAGMWPELKRTPLNATLSEKRERDGVTIQNVYFESLPGFYVVGNLYRPLKIEGKIPAVACALGHWADGRFHQDDSANYPNLGRTLAQMGITVFIYDMTGVNESARQINHRVVNPALDLWGIGNFQLNTWDSSRVMDFLQSLPEVDPERIGMTGASGGGTQTFILFPIDARIRCSVPVNMISSTMQGGCVCENAPGLRIDANNMEIGAMMAPRPMLMISTQGDWTALTPEVEYPAIRAVYELYGAADRVTNAHFGFPHNYNQASRAAMYPFFARYLLGRSEGEKITEAELPRIDPRELAVWTEKVPENLLKFEELVERLKNARRERIPRDAERLDELKKIVRGGLRQIVGSDWPKPGDIKTTMLSEEAVGKNVQRRERRGRFVDVIIMRDDRLSSIPPVWLRVQPRSNESYPPETMLLTPFGVHENREAVAKQRRGKLGFFTCFNRTDAAEAVYDILTGLPLLEGDSPARRLVLSGEGECGPMTLVARALMPDGPEAKRLRTIIDMNQFDVDSDEDYLKHLNLPHIRQIGGLNAVAAMACNGPIWFHNVGEHFDEPWVQAAAKANGVEVRVTREKADEKAIGEWVSRGR